MPCSLTHWGRVTHICVGKLKIIGSDNGLLPGRRQFAGILLIGPYEQTSVKFKSEFKHFRSIKCTWKWRLRNGVHFVSASMCLKKAIIGSGNGFVSDCTYTSDNKLWIGLCVMKLQWNFNKNNKISFYINAIIIRGICKMTTIYCWKTECVDIQI